MATRRNTLSDIMKYFAADFETSTDLDYKYHVEHNDTLHSKVYLWCMQELFTDEKIQIINTIPKVDKKAIKIGYSIESFIKRLANLKNSVIVYFHNLKFDGSFIVDYLNRNGYEHRDIYPILEKNHPNELIFDLHEKEKYQKDFEELRKSLTNHTYEYLITNTGMWHYLKIHLRKHTIEFRDSMKLFNTDLDSLLKAHNTKEKIGIEKTGLDTYKLRAPDYKVTKEELTRCINDTIGLAYVLGIHKLDKESEAYLNSNTIGNCALNRFVSYLEEFHKVKYRDKFPELDEETDRIIRESYKGGWSYVNPIYANKILKDITVYDKNSMYPAVMSTDKMPYGLPIIDKEYDKNFNIDYLLNEPEFKFIDKNHIFYIIKFDAAFIVKKDGLPFLKTKGLFSSATIYFDSSPICFPEPLFTLFQENYNYLITSPTVRVIAFKAVPGLLKHHINNLYAKKLEYGESNNSVLKDVYKVLMNSLYGKFAQRRLKRHKYKKDDKIVDSKIAIREAYERDYIPLATAITGYSKLDLIRKARSFGDRFVYSDTDSIHVLNGNLCGLNDLIDNKKLGYWKIEHSFDQAKYLHAKCYIGSEYNKHTKSNQLLTTVAGLKKQYDPTIESGEKLTFENFKVGVKINGNLKMITVPGGVYLKPSPFEIRKQEIYSTPEKLQEVLSITGGFNDDYYLSDEFYNRYITG